MRKEHEYNFGNLLEKVLYNRAKRSLKWAEQVNEEASGNGFIDNQWFLDFHDDLNKLSVDEDREDVKTRGNNKVGNGCNPHLPQKVIK